MANLNFLEEMQGVTSAELTVQAQALNLNEIDPNEELYHPTLSPYQDTDDIELNSIFETDYRPVADRREWDGPDRFIPVVTPKLEKIQMVPIGAYNVIGELELTKLGSEAKGNLKLFQELAAASIPARVDRLVGATYRLVETEFFESWAKGTITAKNPTDGAVAQSFSLGFAAARLQTAGTAWDDGGVDAFNLFMSWLRDGRAYLGAIGAVLTTEAVFVAIQADAPNILDLGGQGILPTQSQIEDYVTGRMGRRFRFIINEHAADPFTDGGTAYTRTRTFPDQYMMAIPASGQIGATFRAPVHNARMLKMQNSDAPIDVSGVTIVYSGLNDDKGAKIRSQANWMSLPAERNIWSIDTGVATS